MLDLSTNEEKTINQQLKEAGLELDSHESDLYVKNSDQARLIIAGYEFQQNVTHFRSQIDGKIWLDIPFACDNWWQKRTNEVLK